MGLKIRKVNKMNTTQNRVTGVDRDRKVSIAIDQQQQAKRLMMHIY